MMDDSNPYLRDARVFLEPATKLLDGGVPNDRVHEAVLLTVLGFERLAKAVLYNINPVFVLKNTNFKHAAPVVYGDLMTSHAKSQMADKPDGDVVAFRSAVLRAASLSVATAQHKPALLAMGNDRDIVVHRDLEELDRQRSKERLVGHFFSIASDFAKELGVEYEDVAGNILPSPMDAAERAENALAKYVEAKLAKHEARWEQVKEDRRHKLRALKKTKDTTEKHGFSTIECPACGQNAMLVLEADWDIDKEEGGGYISGVYVDHLSCNYCGLVIDDQEVIGYLKLEDHITGAEY